MVWEVQTVIFHSRMQEKHTTAVQQLVDMIAGVIMQMVLSGVTVQVR